MPSVLRRATILYLCTSGSHCSSAGGSIAVRRSRDGNEFLAAYKIVLKARDTVDGYNKMNLHAHGD